MFPAVILPCCQVVLNSCINHSNACTIRVQLICFLTLNGCTYTYSHISKLIVNISVKVVSLGVEDWAFLNCFIFNFVFNSHLKHRRFCLDCILVLFSPKLSSEHEVSSHGLPDERAVSNSAGMFNLGQQIETAVVHATYRQSSKLQKSGDMSWCWHLQPRAWQSFAVCYFQRRLERTGVLVCLFLTAFFVERHRYAWLFV